MSHATFPPPCTSNSTSGTCSETERITSMPHEPTEKMPDIDMHFEPWCGNCRNLKQELDTVKKDHSSDYNMLKEKIISTDMLIKKYSTKCQEYELQSKKLEEANAKVEKSQHEWENMAGQLKKALEEVEPLRKAKERQDKKKDNYQHTIQELQDKLLAFESLQKQLSAVQKENEKEKSEIEDEQKQNKQKIKELESNLKKSECLLKKATDELEAKKTECKDLRQKARGLTKCNDRLESYAVKCEDILRSHGLQSELGRRRKTPTSSMTTELSYQEALSSDEELTIEKIFTELGVTDAHRYLTPLSPAISPIPSPVPMSHQSSDVDTASNDSCSSSESMDDLADMLQSKLLSPSPKKAKPGKRRGKKVTKKKAILFRNELKTEKILEQSMVPLQESLSDSDQEKITDVPFPSFTDMPEESGDLPSLGLSEKITVSTTEAAEKSAQTRRPRTRSITRELPPSNNLENMETSSEIIRSINKEENTPEVGEMKSEKDIAEVKSNISTRSNSEPHISNAAARAMRSCSIPGAKSPIQPTQRTLRRSHSSDMDSSVLSVPRKGEVVEKTPGSLVFTPVNLKRKPSFIAFVKGETVQGSIQPKGQSADLKNERDVNVNKPVEHISKNVPNLSTREGDSAKSSQTKLENKLNDIVLGLTTETSTLGSRQISDDRESNSNTKSLKTEETSVEVNPEKTKELSKQTRILTVPNFAPEIIKSEEPGVVLDTANNVSSLCMPIRLDKGSTVSNEGTAKTDQSVSKNVSVDGDLNPGLLKSEQDTEDIDLTENDNSLNKDSSMDCDSNMTLNSLKPEESKEGDKALKKAKQPDSQRSIPVHCDSNVPGKPIRTEAASEIVEAVKHNKSPSRPSSIGGKLNVPLEKEKSEMVSGAVDGNSNIRRSLLCRQRAIFQLGRVSESSSESSSEKKVNSDTESKMSKEICVQESSFKTGEIQNNLSTSQNMKSPCKQIKFDLQANQDRNLECSVDNIKSELRLEPISISHESSDGEDRSEHHTPLTKQGSFPFTVTLGDDVENSDSDSQSKIMSNTRKSKVHKKEKFTSSRKVSLEESGIDSPLAGSYGFVVGKLEDSKLAVTQSLSDQKSDKVPPGKGIVVKSEKKGKRHAKKSSSQSTERNLQQRSESVDSGMGNDLPPMVVDKSSLSHSRVVGASIRQDSDPSSPVPGPSGWVPHLPDELSSPPPSPAPSAHSSVSETHSIYNFIDFEEFDMGNPISPLPPSPAREEEGEEVGSPVVLPGAESSDSSEQGITCKKTRRSKILEMAFQAKSTAVHAQTKQIETVTLSVKKKKGKVSKRKSIDTPAQPAVPEKKVAAPEFTISKCQPRAFTQEEINNVDLEIHNITQYTVMYTEDVVARLSMLTPPPTSDLLADRIAQHVMKIQVDLLPMWSNRCAQGKLPSDKPWLSEPEYKIISVIHALYKQPEHRDLLEKLAAIAHKMLFDVTLGPTTTSKGLMCLCRVIVSLCRMSGEVQRPRILSYDAVNQQLNGYPSVVMSVAAVWPRVLRKEPVGADVRQPVIKAMEYACFKTLHSNKGKHQKMKQCLKQLCNWNLPLQDAKELASSLLCDLPNLSTENNSTNLLFECEKAVELLAVTEGWTWTNNVLIIELMWPTLQLWVSQPEVDPPAPGRDRHIESLLRILGVAASRCPVGRGEESSTVMEVLRLLGAVLQGLPGRKVSVSVQLAAVSSLLRLSPYWPDMAATTIQEWISRHGQQISRDLKQQVSSFLEHYTPQTAGQS